MIKRLIEGGVGAILILLLTVTGVNAANTVSYGTIGTAGATATQIGSDIELYTPAGLTGSGYVRLNIPSGITLGSITSLSYTAQVTTPGAGGFAPEVVVNIDADNDGAEGDGINWMLSSYNPATLNGDNFLSGDNWPASVGVADGAQVNRDALSGYNYWSANDTRTGFGSLWTPFTTIVPGMLPVHGIDATDMVYSIDFVVGTSPNFDGMRTLFSSVELNGIIYPVIPPDTMAPLVEISSPINGALLHGLVDIVGSVTDNVKLSHYNLSLYPSTTDLSDGNTHSADRLNDSNWCTIPTSGTIHLTSDFSGNLCTNWDTSNYTDGDYQIRLAARDATGNRDTSDPDNGNTSSVHVIGITIDNTAPVVDITSHENGDLVRGMVEIRGSVTDANPDHYYAVLRDSSNNVVAGVGVVYRYVSFTDEVLFSFDSTGLIEGDTYTIWLAARDAAGNRDDSAGSLETVDIVIDNIPDDKDACKKGGWELFESLDFKNQGACVSYLESNERAGKRD